jgi:hypothetical protein
MSFSVERKWMTICMMAEEIGVLNDLCQAILTKDLRMKHVSASSVP